MVTYTNLFQTHLHNSILFLTPKGHPLFRRLSDAINAYNEHGLKSKWLSDEFLAIEEKQQYPIANDHVVHAIKISEMRIVFLVLAVGLVISSATFTYEMCTH